MPIPDKLKQYGNILGKGLIAEMMPGIVKGFLIEWLKREKADVKAVVKYVEVNKPLFDDIDANSLEKLRWMASQISTLDWLNAEWVVVALKQDFPAIASLIISWEPAQVWLTEQVGVLKGKLL